MDFDPVNLLNQMSEYQSQLDLLAIKKQEVIDAVLTPEIKAKLADIDAEFSDQAAVANSKIAELTALVKEVVSETGYTAKGDNLMAVYVKGRVSWDGKKLDGMRILIPQLDQARSEGTPSVTIRKI